MELKIQKKKRYLILLLICLVLSAITAGIYLFVDSTTSIPYTVDKYTDTLDWCEPNAENGELKIDCKALLLSIKNQEDNSTCFDVQVISNTKELKDLTVCERGDTLTYTNDILAYKVLMPVDIAFTYTQGLLNRFSFKNVSFTTLDDTYIQSIVNEDIANLVTLDPSSTTIQNSVDFCPKPETLPSYVTEENKTKYTEFFNKNVMNKNNYTDSSMYSWEDSTIRILFACDSAENMGYSDICNKIKINNAEQIAMNVNTTNTAYDLNNIANDSEIILTKRVSLIYDSMFLNTDTQNYINLSLVNELTRIVNRQPTKNIRILCSLNKIYEIINQKASKFYKDLQNPQINLSLDSINSFSCIDILKYDFNIQLQEIYLKIYFSNFKENIFTIYERCSNLNAFINNE